MSMSKEFHPGVFSIFEEGWPVSWSAATFQSLVCFSVPYLNRELKGQNWTKEACFACPTCWAVVLALFSEGRRGSWVRVEEHWKGIQASCRNLNYCFSLSAEQISLNWNFWICGSLSDRWCWDNVHGAGWYSWNVECPNEALGKHLVN